MATHEIKIPNWRPARLNQFTDKSWYVRSKLKGADFKTIATYVKSLGVPPATGRRKVSLLVVLGKRQRECDPDAFWKSLNDALKKAGMLIDDNRNGCQLGEVEFVRSHDGSSSTTIILEDVGPAAKIRRLKKGEVI